MTEPVKLRLEPELKMRLDRLAKATGRSRAALAAEAVRQYVELNEWQASALEDGVRDAESGRFIDHAQLKAKWDRRLAAATDAQR